LYALIFIGIDNAAGIWMTGERSDPPYSSTSTELSPSSLNRCASTHPAEPAPTMM
jgi:hypothetical protein